MKEMFSRLKSLEWLFHLLFLLTPLIWTNSTSELFEFPKMVFVYTMAILIGGLFVVDRILTKNWAIKKSRFDIPLALFLGSQLVSTLISINQHTSLLGYYSRFHGGLLSTLSYLTLYFVYVNSFGKVEVKSHIKSVLLGGLLASLYAIPEHFGLSLSCLALGAGATAECWVQDVVSRIFGTFGQPNWLAAYMITIIFVPIANLISKIKNQKSKIPFKNHLLDYTLVGVYFLTLIFTKSRSGMLGMAIGLVVFSGLMLWPRETRKSVVKVLATYYLLLVTIFIIFGKSLVPIYDSLLANFSKESPTSQEDESEPQQIVGTQLETGGTESGEIRRIVWQGAIDIWKRYPLFGSGVETFAYAYNVSRRAEHNLVSEWDFLYNKAHNEWLNFASTTGAFGLVSYLLIIGWFVISTAKLALTKSDGRFLMSGLLTGYVSLAISNFFGFSTVPVAILFFMFPAMVTAYDNDVMTKTKTSKLTTGGWLLLMVVAVFVFSLMSANYKMFKADKLYNEGKNYSRNNQLTDSVNALNAAVRLSPKEPVYKDELAKTAAKVALGLNEQGETESANQFAQLAVGFNKASLVENPYYLPFYKTGANVLANMAVFDERYLFEAEQLLQNAIALAPTDPKIRLTLGLIYIQQDRLDEAQIVMERAVELKPNYEQARYSLGLVYEDLDKNDKAREQYEYILVNIQPENRLVKEALDGLQ